LQTTNENSGWRTLCLDGIHYQIHHHINW
jgi:hypothetical protein